MPHKVSEISVKWLDSKDASKTDLINVKHVIVPSGKIAVGITTHR